MEQNACEGGRRDRPLMERAGVLAQLRASRRACTSEPGKLEELHFGRFYFLSEAQD